MYAPEIGRWNAVDPLGEKYMAISPCVYCVNNPVIFVDVDGREIINGHEDERNRKLDAKNQAEQRFNSLNEGDEGYKQAKREYKQAQREYNIINQKYEAVQNAIESIRLADYGYGDPEYKANDDGSISTFYTPFVPKGYPRYLKHGVAIEIYAYRGASTLANEFGDAEFAAWHSQTARSEKVNRTPYINSSAKVFSEGVETVYEKNLSIFLKNNPQYQKSSNGNISQKSN